MEYIKTLIGRFRLVAFLEGTSFLVLLFIGMPMKYWYGIPEVVRYVGLAHGYLFIVYCFLLIRVRVEYQWSAKNTVLAFIASLVPFGTFIADARIFRFYKESI